MRTDALCLQSFQPPLAEHCDQSLGIAACSSSVPLRFVSVCLYVSQEVSPGLPHMDDKGFPMRPARAWHTCSIQSSHRPD